MKLGPLPSDPWIVNGNAISYPGQVQIAPSSVQQAGINLEPGVAPTSPNNGDLWATSIGLFVRLNGTTTDLSGGGGGLATASNIAALAATNPTVGAIYLSDPIRGSSVFLWFEGTFTTAVTNDPAQGIYVAWSGDSAPGATGAWVRQYSGSIHAGWFGWVDGATANDSAMNGFGTWARAQPATTGGLTLFFLPGTYNFNGANTQSWLWGIKQLTIDGYGATWQNTYNGANNFGNQLPMGGTAASPELHLAVTGLQALIATTAVGQQSVTCLTPSQAANFTVGGAAVVMSLDIQYVGYPPCCDQFDFVTVTAVNASTGVVSFSGDYLSYIHRSDFPDGPNTCGKARIWPLDATVNGVFSPFAVKHVYKGLTINIATNNILTYQTFTGDSIHLEDVKICGVSPSVCRRFSALRCTFTLLNEPDKLVNECEFIDCRGPGLLNAQTSSINMIKARGCTFSQFVAGNAKNTIVDNCNLQGFGDGGYLYGTARNVNIINSRIASYPTPPSLAYTDFSTNRPIDGGITLSYANGVFTTINSGLQAFSWNTIPGNYLVLQSNTPSVGGFSADRAVGFVTAMADVSGGVAITTTLPYASLPSWASWINAFGAITGGSGGTPGTYTGVALTGGTGTGAIATIVVGAGGNVTSVATTLANGGGSYVPGDSLTAAPGGVSGFSVLVASVGNVAINRRGRVSVFNSHGCDTIRALSEVTARGYLPGEYSRIMLMNANSNGDPLGIIGEIIELDFNVIQAGSSGLHISLTSFAAPTYPGFATPLQYSIVIDATVLGPRTFTLAALNGAAGADAVLLNSVSKTALQAVWVNGLFVQWNITPAVLPIIEIIFKTNTGIAGKVLPPLGSTLIGITGTAP